MLQFNTLPVLCGGRLSTRICHLVGSLLQIIEWAIRCFEAIAKELSRAEAR